MNTANPENSPSPKEWTQLYEHAARFQELAPWGWMSDSDLFGVKDPQTGQIGYGCVLGLLGECFGLALYAGSRGLEGYYKVREGVDSMHPDDLLHHKDGILLSYDMPSELETPERALFRQLGIKPATSRRIAVFRSYRPGYFPWILTSEEVRCMTVCLQQAFDVALRFKTNPGLLEPPQCDQYLTRVRRGNGDWQDEWHEVVPMREITVFKKSVDTRRLENIRTCSLRQKKMKWEIDFFHAPTPVRENGLRPYFPTLTLFADHDSNFIFHNHLCAPDHQLVELHEQFLRALETSQILPAQVRVSKAELAACLKPLADLLDIKIQLVKELSAVNDVRDNMSKFFRSSRSK